MHLFFGLFRLAFSNLKINKLRSALTILGMIFGTGAVIATLSSNEGAQRFIKGELERLGTNSVSVMPENSDVKLEPTDGALILRHSKLFQTLSFVAEIPQTEAQYLARAFPARTLGIDPIYFPATHLELKTGRTFDETDQDQFRFVAVLGHAVKRGLFKQDNAMGKSVYLSINDVTFPFQVVGELKERDGGSDNTIYIPRKLVGKISLPVASTLTMVATLSNDETSGLAKSQIRSLLKSRYPAGLRISDAREAIERTKGIWEKQNLVGICLALVSLVTGGVGIMNIMLLSVSQRQREIGLRKAVGATDFFILIQFLLESMILSSLGGIAGVVVGIAFGRQVAAMMGQWTAAISHGTILLALAFAIATGAIFGLIPAVRASRLEPYEALRG